MQVSSIGFGASIPNTAAAKSISHILRMAEDYDYGISHTDYNGLCKNINKFLPNQTDEVIFKSCNNRYNDSFYIEGEIYRNGEKIPFFSNIYYRSGSNMISGDILNSIRKIIK